MRARRRRRVFRAGMLRAGCGLPTAAFIVALLPTLGTVTLAVSRAAPGKAGSRAEPSPLGLTSMRRSPMHPIPAVALPVNPWMAATGTARSRSLLDTIRFLPRGTTWLPASKRDRPPL